ncbi:MAG: hypothetical protein IT447_09375 [Phycisphaerales bacterium]|jgi:hypothetical protein|nr:hypothetical protein [Phycisphaerales bacterium]
MAWVVPAIAAELWNVSVQHIMDCIREGRIPSRSENGFVFVNVAPHNAGITPPKKRPEDRPPTYVMVQPAESTVNESADLLSPEELEELQEPLEDDGPSDLTLVHHRRHETSRLRTPPRRVA